MGLWLWIIGIVAVIVVAMLLVERRRGSTGASKATDLRGNQPRPPGVDDGPMGPGGYGSGGPGG